MTTTAFLIIDVQRMLFSGKYEVFDSRRVINRINYVTGTARRAGAPVIVIQHEEPGSPMAHGSEGWQLDPELAVQPADVYVRKTTCDSFHKTALDEILKTRGITQLVVCGAQSEFCVDSTVRGALALGYPTTLVSDGHTTIGNGVLTAAQIIEHHNVTLRHVDSFGPRVRAVAAADVKIEA